MSKVYSFRLNEENPREAQAREVIEAWVGEGYSLRYVITEALLSFKTGENRGSEIGEIINELMEIVRGLDRKSEVTRMISGNKHKLPPAFTNAIKNAARFGISNE